VLGHLGEDREEVVGEGQLTTRRRGIAVRDLARLPHEVACAVTARERPRVLRLGDHDPLSVVSRQVVDVLAHVGDGSVEEGVVRQADHVERHSGRHHVVEEPPAVGAVAALVEV
jgi:hypothetical protein